MVQPNYSPKEALRRVKLMMGYDPSKTLTENTIKSKRKLNEDLDTSQRNLLTKCDAAKSDLNKDLKFMSNEDHIDMASLFNQAFASAFGTDNEMWRKALKSMGDKGGFGDLCSIREKYKDQADETLEDGIDADIDFDREYAEFIATFQKMIERTKNAGLKTKDADSQNIDAWENKFPCVFMSLANTDKKIFKDINNYPYILIKGKSGKQYKLFFDGRVKTMDEKQTGKRVACNGDVVVITENIKKKDLLEQFDDSSLGGNTQPNPDPSPDPTPKPKPKKSGGKYTSCPETLPIKQFCKNQTIREVQACMKMPAKYQTGNFGPITKEYLESRGQNGTSINTETIIAVCGGSGQAASGQGASGQAASGQGGVVAQILSQQSSNSGNTKPASKTGYEDYTTDEVEMSQDTNTPTNTNKSTPTSGTGYEGYESDSVETTSKTTPSTTSTTSNTNSVQQGKKSFIGPLDNDVVEQ